MAADTRQYKSKEQDGHGNEVIIRDQQLVEQTSQTTMASTEYFEIVDVDGRMAKIPKDNMISVVREALGSLLNGLADQTTVTKALTLNGDTLGASTAATLASVLGVGSLTQLGESITPNTTQTFSFPTGSLLLIGHWNYGWCLYQFGSSVTQNVIAGTLLSGLTITYNNPTLTITAGASGYAIAYVLA